LKANTVQLSGTNWQFVLQNVNKEHLCAGVGTIQVRRKSDGKHIGGDDQLIPFDEKIYVKDFFVEENYGTVLVAICFVNYIYPLLEGDEK